MIQDQLIVQAKGKGLHEITEDIDNWLNNQSLLSGLLTLFLRHTSASLMIQENVDPDVQPDIEDFFDQTVPEGVSLYRHKSQGIDDMLAHIKSALTLNQLTIPISDRDLLLGQNQGIFLFEHRRSPRLCEIIQHFQGK